MAKGKLSVEEKRDMARKAILDVSMELFFEKGFAQTTTRDIITKAGILNGSLYNRFRNKDEILACIIKEAITAVLEDCRTILEEEKNLVIASAFPGALEIYVSSRSPRIATLLYEVHCKWESISEYVDINKGWKAKMVEFYGVDNLDPELATLKIIAAVGAVGNMVGYYANGGTLEIRNTLREHIIHVAAIMCMPIMNVDQIVDKLLSLICDHQLVFMGHNLSKEIPELSEDVHHS